MDEMFTRFGLVELVTIGERINAQEFDHPFILNPDGTVTDAPSGIYAPDEVVFDHSGMGRDVALSSGWECVAYGMSGQHAYRGGVMHPSEYIGAGMARLLLSDESQTLAVVAVMDEYANDDSDAVVGWTVVRYTGKD